MFNKILILMLLSASKSYADDSSSVAETTVVCDSPSEVYHSGHIPGNPYFLNYGGSYPNSYLTVVIWERDIPELEINPFTYFSAGSFCIAGELESFKNRDQITLRKPSQITPASLYRDRKLEMSK